MQQTKLKFAILALGCFCITGRLTVKLLQKNYLLVISKHRQHPGINQRYNKNLN